MVENTLNTRPVLGRAERSRKRVAMAVLLGGLAAVTMVGCSSTPDKQAPTTVTVTPAADAPKAPAPTAQPTPAPTITVAPSPVTVTVTPPPAATPPAAPPSPVVNQIAGPFQSPSGNIRCNMFTATDGRDTAICAVTEKDWLGPMPDGCGFNWGNRIDLEAGSPARFGCYSQDMPPTTHTLQYGQTQSLGSLTCTSESSGMTCRDNTSGNFFRISREGYQIG